MLEISSPAKRLLSFQFIRFWVECGHWPAVSYCKQDKKSVDQGKEKNDY